MNDFELTTLIARRAPLSTPTSSSWSITILEGEGLGTALRIDDVVTRRLLVGTSPTSDVRLTDRTVSRRHAALESDATGLRVVDLGSRNGTWLGATRVRDAYLASGDVIRFGNTRVKVESDGTTRPVAASSEACFGRVIGASAEMRALYPLFEKVAAADVPVLLEGEAGTGKEALAESIHEASCRRQGPFMVLDCTSVSSAQVEAELFGLERGSSGNEAPRPGLFEAAHGGTLFIDEIGDLDLPLQAKLLRAIERKEIRRVGGAQWLRLDVRVVAATRRDLDREIAARRFRDDLYHLLAVARLELPPLRKREGDVAFLTRFFWQKLGGDPAMLSPDLLLRFEGHEWPGNVRELSYAVARQLAVGAFETPRPVAQQASATLATDFIADVVRSGEALPIARQRVLGELERRYVEHMLELHGGNVTRAAAASGIGRRYFQIVRARR